ncbi:TRAP transporter small permease [Cohaesibacter haloalkalitolerans]|uniref:TRAP transporter small permease n=1 Tax=Cohaesibacter haloalkalitolerans TaxID=1162980 RepID=UPI000E646D18|nr:TRAP transporter small permease [Cohaesibacter haloalkalitolerans]
MRILERFLCWCITALFVFFVSITFLQVVLRYLFSNSLGWIDEISRFSFIWMVFLAAAICAKRGTHMAITLLEEFLGPKVQKPLLVLADISMLVFASVIGIGGWQLMQLNWTSTSPAIGMPIAWVQLALPLFGLFTVVFSIDHLINILRSPIQSVEQPVDLNGEGV